ncbi:MAG: N-acetylmuramoyl-L-alanine amidase, partial [Campylobacterota bacterium]
ELYIKNSQKNNSFLLTLPKAENKKEFQAQKKTHKILDISSEGGNFIIEFDKQTPYKNMVLRQDKIRYVYDFKAIFPQVSQTLEIGGNRVKVSQYYKKTTRVVVSVDREVDLNPTLENNSFVLHFLSAGDAPTLSNQKRRKLRVVLDPGHGGKDPGAVGYRNFREKIVVENFTKRVKQLLEQSGIEVLLTRDDDTYITLDARTRFANEKDADVFVSIHANAADSKSLHGVETYFLSPARSERAKRVAAKENKEVMDKMAQWSSKNTFLSLMNREKIIESNKLAIDVQKNMLFNVNRVYKDVRDGGVREAPFWVLVGAQMPSVLVELGYISNAKEAQRLVLSKHRRYQEALARGIAEGIINYLSLARR